MSRVPSVLRLNRLYNARNLGSSEKAPTLVPGAEFSMSIAINFARALAQLWILRTTGSRHALRESLIRVFWQRGR